MVIVTNLSVERNTNKVLTDVSCTLEAGKITSFLGVSGAGKTTLLKAIVGLIQPTTGSIFVNNLDLALLTPPKKAETIGYVFQEFNLFPHLTALENCTAPLMIHGVLPEAARKKALNILKQLGMDTYCNQYPSQLSGGQQQRIAIARALCLNPSVLLLDEPTASLDPINTELLIRLLQNLASQGLTIGITTQDMVFARKLFDRAYLLEVGTIKEFCSSADDLKNCPQLTTFLA